MGVWGRALGRIGVAAGFLYRWHPVVWIPTTVGGEGLFEDMCCRQIVSCNFNCELDLEYFSAG